MASNEIKSNSIKRSKSLYATAIYGFIVMFIIIVYPFIPLYKEGSLFESGLKMFNANIKGNLIVTISMLIHSIILLGLGIFYVNKLKIHRAGVGYSFYKLFSTTIILAIFTYVCFVLTGNEQAVYESYGLEYWYVVLGLYLVGLVFSLIAHLTNKELRASKWKVLYLVLSFVAQWGIYFLMLNRSNNATNGYLYDFVKNEEGFIMSFSQNVVQIKKVQDVYRLAMLIMFAVASVSTANICMPINEPFQYMYNKKCERTKYSKVSSFATKLRIFLAAILLFCFIVNGGKEEILTTLFIVLITVADFLGARAYNSKIAVKYEPEEVKRVKVEAESQEQFDDDFDDVDDDIEEEIELGEEDAYGNVILWDEERLIAQGENHEFTDKSSICDICSNLQTALKANGINVPLNDVQLTFAAILSSKVIFVRSNADSQMIRRFSETVADFFNGELFFEERRNVYANLDGGEQVELSASDKLTNIKYGMISGLLVSNYLRDLFGLVFVDNLSGAEFKGSDVAVINALIDNAVNAKVGKLVNLPETETYSQGLMQLSDTARLIIFVSESQVKELENNWIKYSSIVDLNLEEVVEGDEENSDTDSVRNVSSYGMIYETLEETEETCFLTEDYWRKLDRLEEFLEENTDIRFDNRFIRQIENNVAAIMSCGMDKMSATDTMLATKIIPLVATQKDKIFEAHDQDFSLKLDELFGRENIPCTMAAVANYGLKK